MAITSIIVNGALSTITFYHIDIAEHVMESHHLPFMNPLLMLSEQFSKDGLPHPLMIVKSHVVHWAKFFEGSTGNYFAASTSVNDTF